MGLSACFADLEELSGGFAGCRHDERVVRQVLDEGCDGCFTAHWEIIWSAALKGIPLEGPLGDHQCEGAGGVSRGLNRPLDCGLSVLGALWQDRVRHADGVQDTQGHAAHLDVLGLIMTPGLSSPPDDEDHRDAVHHGIAQGGQRVDRIAEARVLKIDGGQATITEVAPGGERDRAALVRGDHVSVFRKGVGDVCAEVLEQRVRHAGVAGDALGAEDLVKCAA